MAGKAVDSSGSMMSSYGVMRALIDHSHRLGRELVRLLEERTHGIEERVRRFDVRDVSTVGDRDELRVRQRMRCRFRRRERNRIALAVHDERGCTHGVQLTCEVEAVEAFPYGLLHASRDAEGRERSCVLGVREVPRHAQLEQSLTVRIVVALAESGGGELLAQTKNVRTLLSPRELLLELRAELAGNGRRIDEDHAPGRRGARIAIDRAASIARDDRIEQREEPAP